MCGVWQCVAWTEYHRYMSVCVDTQNKSSILLYKVDILDILVLHSFLQIDTNLFWLICMKYFQSKTHRHPQLVTMPVCKAEAHRALELLEDYYTRLDAETDERQLRAAIERVIRIFKSRLFQALLDIQEFYELTLMDETKSTNVKTAEALHMASCWRSRGRRAACAASGTRATSSLGRSRMRSCCATAAVAAVQLHRQWHVRRDQRRPVDCRPSPRRAPLLSRPRTPRPPWPWRPGPARWRGQWAQQLTTRWLQKLFGFPQFI